jgi:hypothetical protein
VDGKLGCIIIEDIYFDVANIDKYDVILGTTFMYAQNVILDVRGRNILIGGHNSDSIKAIAPEDEMQLQVERFEMKHSRVLRGVNPG